MSNLSPADFEKRLRSITEQCGDGTIGMLHRAEAAHMDGVNQKLSGFVALSNAFAATSLDTFQRLNTEAIGKVKTPLSEHYPLLLPRLLHACTVVRASFVTASSGYPMQAYTSLRNTFDDNVMTSAAVQKITTFYDIEGLDLGHQPKAGEEPDMKAVGARRRKNEFEVAKVMQGEASGLSDVARADLRKLNFLFDFETHGARLSLARAMNWMKGAGTLDLAPEFDAARFAMFMNRYCEVAWMTHRMLPLLQPPEAPLSEQWRNRWSALDESFQLTVEALSEGGKKTVGKSLVEFVTSKFPFDAGNTFPL